MLFRYSSPIIYEIVRAPKKCNPEIPPFYNYGNNGKGLECSLELVEGGLYPLKLVIYGCIYDEPKTYKASLILESRRIRGIDFEAASRSYIYKIHIPAGWHENIIDPNLPDRDGNRHEPLDIDPQDLMDFQKIIARRWNIMGLYEEEELL